MTEWMRTWLLFNVKDFKKYKKTETKTSYRFKRKDVKLIGSFNNKLQKSWQLIRMVILSKTNKNLIRTFIWNHFYMNLVENLIFILPKLTKFLRLSKTLLKLKFWKILLQNILKRKQIMITKNKIQIILCKIILGQ